MAAQAEMRFRLALLVLLLPAALYAESGSYRVEVLVFSHLDTDASPIEIDALRHFGAEFPLDGARLENNFEDPVKLEVMSDMMEDAWRRLRLSSGYQPLLFTAWEQSRIDYHPPVRLHDGEVLTERLDFPGGMAWLDLRSTDMFAPYRAPYHRLDGTVQLRRSRFLHLDIDLEYRAEILRPGSPLPGSAEEAQIAAESMPAEPDPPPGPALVHRLRQTRQVRTGELQYFDTPYLGALARVTATAGE